MREPSKFINTIVLLFCCFHILSCSDGNSDFSQPQVASQFRIALNNNDVTQLVKLTQLPLTVIEQEWESAQDGSGFVLGKRTITVIEKIDGLKKYFETFAPRVTIEGEQAITVSLSEFANFQTELGDSINQWRALNIYLYKRGEGDVEHIVLLGFGSTNKKIQAIYLN